MLQDIKGRHDFANALAGAFGSTSRQVVKDSIEVVSDPGGQFDPGHVSVPAFWP